jgi:UDP-N-acetyl-D-glucosamine dehydrogenase
MKNALLDKIKKKKAKVGIIGLGYVGLELALTITRKNFETYLFDNNKIKIKNLKKNISPIKTIKKKDILLFNKDNIFNLENLSKIKECDIIIVCLPTPLKNNSNPDMSYLTNSLKQIKKFLRQNQLIILESTVYPGATNEIFVKTLQKSFNIGKDFFISFSSERISPGGTHTISLYKIPKVVSGSTKNCLKISSYFYKNIFDSIYKSSSLEEAELIKLYENCYRSVNIGLVNNLKMMCSKMNLNVFKVIEGASTKPYGFSAFLPGPGIGGHCIPIDPMFLSYVGKKINFDTGYVNLSHKINKEVTNWTTSQIIKNVKKKSNILLVGMAYKKDIDDTRESASVKIFSLLKKKKHNLSFYDPLVPKIFMKNKFYYSEKRLFPKMLAKFDCIVITTDHSKVNYNLILKHSKKVIDTRGIYKNSKNSKVILS